MAATNTAWITEMSGLTGGRELDAMDRLYRGLRKTSRLPSVRRITNRLFMRSPPRVGCWVMDDRCSLRC
jgi:hypothetical protein